MTLSISANQSCLACQRNKKAVLNGPLFSWSQAIPALLTLTKCIACVIGREVDNLDQFRSRNLAAAPRCNVFRIASDPQRSNSDLASKRQKQCDGPRGIVMAAIPLIDAVSNMPSVSLDADVGLRSKVDLSHLCCGCCVDHSKMIGRYQMGRMWRETLERKHQIAIDQPGDFNLGGNGHYEMLTVPL